VGIDLRALEVFEAVLELRSTTKAGHRLAMSQPAVSSALNRLRHATKDELFVRGSDGMRPTPRAMQLAPALTEALGRLRDAFDPVSFDPVTSRRTFSLAMADHAAALLLPGLAARLRDAPGVDIRVLPNWNVNAPELLDLGRIDFAVGLFPDPPSRLEAMPLIRDDYVVGMRRDHPLASGLLTLERFLEAPHLLVSLSGEATGFVDRLLTERGLSRRVAMTVNQFAGVPPILAASDLVVTVVRRAITLSPHAPQLVSRPLPVPLRSSALSLLWHKRLNAHPANEWLKNTLVEIAVKLP
jgi:DNA-binding transcriptional LysR family regulator